MALIIIASSIITLKIMNNSEFLVAVRDSDDGMFNNYTSSRVANAVAIYQQHDSLATVIALGKEFKNLKELIILTQAAAYWAFVVCGITVFVGALSIVLLLVNEHPTGKLVMGVIVSLLRD